MRKILLGMGAASVIAVATGAVVAHSGTNPAVDARHFQMQFYGFYSGILGNMAKGDVAYDAEAAQAAANGLLTASMLDQTAFWPEGTAKGEVDGSRALPAIWENMDDYMSKSNDLTVAAKALADVAGQDLDSLRGAMGAVGKACGSCHKAYRGRR